MPTAVTLPLPTGKLGVIFKRTSEPPTVECVKDDSPMAGKIKEGYIFEALHLSDGTEFTDMTATDLVETLNKYQDQEGRKMKLRLALPDKTKVVLPPGDTGFSLESEEEEGSPAMITAIDDDCAIKTKVRVGLAIDCLALEDGTKYYGHSAEEFEALLSATNAEKRVLILKNPATATLNKKFVKLPDSKEVKLPTGKLGVVFRGFRGTSTRIHAVKEDSPVREQFRVGLIADKLIMPDGTEFSGLRPEELMEALTESSETEGRFMVLKSAKSSSLAEKSTTKVMIPTGYLGLRIDGSPVAITEVLEDSPMLGKVWAGQTVLAMGFDNGTEYNELEADDVVELLNDSIDNEGCWMLLENSPPIVELPEVREVALPAQDLRVKFEGKPAVITKISSKSPVKDDFMVGLAVDTLTLANGSVRMELTSEEVQKILEETADTEGRKIVLKNPDIATMTELPTTMKVELPPGKLGTKFSGTPPMITGFSEGSPMAKKFLVGLVVDKLTLADKSILTGLSNKELAQALNESAETEGRVVVLKNPAKASLSKRKLIVPSDKIEVTLPTGSLGVKFKYPTPVVKALRDTSALQDKVTVGMVVETLIMPDGSSYSGLQSDELADILFDTSDVEGRKMVLKKPMKRGRSFTRKSSSKSVVDKEVSAVKDEAPVMEDEVAMVQKGVPDIVDIDSISSSSAGSFVLDESIPVS